jgi:hypothetical protein
MDLIIDDFKETVNMVLEQEPIDDETRALLKEALVFYDSIRSNSTYVEVSRRKRQTLTPYRLDMCQTFQVSMINAKTKVKRVENSYLAGINELKVANSNYDSYRLKLYLAVETGNPQKVGYAVRITMDHYCKSVFSYTLVGYSVRNNLCAVLEILKKFVDVRTEAVAKLKTNYDNAVIANRAFSIAAIICYTRGYNDPKCTKTVDLYFEVNYVKSAIFRTH